MYTVNFVDRNTTQDLPTADLLIRGLRELNKNPTESLIITFLGIDSILPEDDETFASLRAVIRESNHKITIQVINLPEVDPILYETRLMPLTRTASKNYRNQEARGIERMFSPVCSEFTMFKPIISPTAPWQEKLEPPREATPLFEYRPLSQKENEQLSRYQEENGVIIDMRAILRSKQEPDLNMLRSLFPS
ncbi:MAG TPA: hypothetical protein VJB34_08185 [Bdellovibrionota bacterium]|nr:MAG: hypothetical protein A3I12_06975 [Gammaproteobacteria bacterium RIFCSPLOWO2_02_FULL_38_11]OGT77576.1 MAG: hypothetical protein A3G71_05745 [Gammaproteobacteria bacterium RIFCSPLOWO2_12_FULL_38_14]HLD74861.1 hypothetical protein [Bdellovibrionota bacterium]